MTDGYEAIYRTMLDSAEGPGVATDGVAGVVRTVRSRGHSNRSCPI